MGQDKMGGDSVFMRGGESAQTQRATDDDDVEGHAKNVMRHETEDEDVEGHRANLNRHETEDEEDVEGHKQMQRATDDEDVEGHKQMPR